MTANGANSVTSSKTNIALGVSTGDDVQQLFALPTVKVI